MKERVLLAIGLLVLVMAIPVFATPITETYTSNGFDFTAILTLSNATTTGGSFSLTFTAENTNANSADINAFTLSLLGGGSGPSIDVTSDTLPSGWTETDNAKINNSGSNIACASQTGFGGWLCASANSTSNAAALAANGGSETFSFSGTYSGTMTEPFELMTNGDWTSGTKSGQKAFAVSDPMTPTTPPPVPEPASLLLLGTGLLGLGSISRKKWFARRR